MNLVGYYNTFGDFPSFVTPIFAKEEVVGDGVFIQVVDADTDTIVNFRKALVPFDEINAHNGIAKKVGDRAIYGVKIDRTQVFIETSEALQHRSLEEEYELTSAFEVCLSDFFNEIGPYKNNFLKYARELAEQGKLDQAIRVLGSSVSMTGWEFLELECVTLRQQELFEKNMSDIEFYIYDNAEIRVKTLTANSDFLNNLKVDSVLVKLNSIYKEILEAFANSSVFGIFSDVELDLKESKLNNQRSRRLIKQAVKSKILIDGNEIVERFRLLKSRMSRQEERLAFLIASIIRFPDLYKDFLKTKEFAKSALLGVQYLTIGLREYSDIGSSTDPKRVHNFRFKVAKILQKIFNSWQTGEEDLFLIYLYKWMINSRTTQRPLMEFADSHYDYSVVFSGELESTFGKFDILIDHFYLDDVSISDGLFEEYSSCFYADIKRYKQILGGF